MTFGYLPPFCGLLFRPRYKELYTKIQESIDTRIFCC